MAAATQEQVRRAIEQSNASGTAAEVLEAITALSVERTNTEPIDVDGLETALPGAAPAIIRKFKAAADQDGRLAAQFNKLCAVGLNLAHPERRQQIDALVGAGVWTADEGAALKALGVWSESPLEYHNATRGLTTDEATVQAVLEQIAAEQEPQVYNHRQSLLSIVLQPDGKAIVSCRVVATTETGQQGETLSAVSTADADSFELPSDLAVALAAVRQFVAGV